MRRQIRKAEKALHINTTYNATGLFKLKEDSYAAKEEKNPLSTKYVDALVQLAKAKDWGLVMEARDEVGQLHASTLLVWDHQTCYYLMGAANPEYSNSGAMSLLLWEGIKIAAEKGLQFNFEGSMIPEIERFFCAFGGTLTPYHQISRTDSSLMKIRNLIR